MKLYFHGFGSSVEGSATFHFLKEYFTDLEGINLDYENSNAFEKIDNDALAKYDLLIGNSFGGLMATYLGLKYAIPFCVINPSIAPSKTLGLSSYLPWEGEIQRLIREEVRNPKIPKVLILSQFDELVDRTIVLATKLQTVSLFQEPEWGHRVPIDDRAAVEKILNETIKRIPTDGRELIAGKQ